MPDTPIADERAGFNFLVQIFWGHLRKQFPKRIDRFYRFQD